MRLPDEWVKQLFADADFAKQLTSLIKTLNGIASFLFVVLLIYWPYQAIMTMISWFK